MIGTKGVWALDRGGDRWYLFGPILERKLKFVVRIMTQRDMIDAAGRVRNIAAMAKSTRCSKKAEVSIHPKEEPAHSKTIRVGFQRVSFTLREDMKLTLVVVKGMGEKPLMLLTIMELYFTRWKCEQSYR